MTNDKIIELLKAPPKPNLEAAKEYCLENAGSFGVSDPKAIKHWAHAANETAARNMISRKFHPERSATERQRFYREHWEGDRGAAVEAAMMKAGVEAWQKTLPKGDPHKKTSHKGYQFYVSIHLGGYNKNTDESLYPYFSRWDHSTVWPDVEWCGVNTNFLNELSSLGDTSASKLAEFGYQNVIEIGNETVVFIKLPKYVALEKRNLSGVTDYVLSNTLGPAVVASSGRRSEYWYRGVKLAHYQGWSEDRKETTGKRIHEAFFDAQGNIKMPVKDVIAWPGKGQDHRNVAIAEAILAKFTSEEILAVVSPSTVLATKGAMSVRVAKLYSAEAVRAGVTVSDILMSDNTEVGEVLLKHFKSEDIKAAVSLKSVMGVADRRYRIELLGLFSREDVRSELSVKDILKNPNSEVRRTLMKNFDPEEIFEACDAKLLSEEVDKLPCSCVTCKGLTDVKPSMNELYSVDIGLEDSYRQGDLKMGDADETWAKRKNRAKMLRYKCTSTDRVYAKFVPVNMQTANEAQAWSHHFTLDEYLNELAAQS